MCVYGRRPPEEISTRALSHAAGERREAVISVQTAIAVVRQMTRKWSEEGGTEKGGVRSDAEHEGAW